MEMTAEQYDQLEQAIANLERASVRIFSLPQRGHIDRAFYHIESAIYQLSHPTNEIPQKTTDATSV